MNNWYWTKESQEAFCAQKYPIFRLNPIGIKTCIKCYGDRWYFTDSNESLQSCAVTYSCYKNATVISNGEWNIIPVLFNFVKFGIRWFLFCIFLPILNPHSKIWFCYFKLKIQIKNCEMSMSRLHIPQQMINSLKKCQ